MHNLQFLHCSIINTLLKIIVRSLGLWPWNKYFVYWPHFALSNHMWRSPYEKPKFSKFLPYDPPPRGGGGRGMYHWGLCIILVNHFLKSILNEDESDDTHISSLNTTPCDGVRAHQGIAPKFPTLSADLSGGSVNLIPFFSYFPPGPPPLRGQSDRMRVPKIAGKGVLFVRQSPAREL